MDGSSFLDLRVGDRVAGPSGPPAIFAPGRSRWYALRVKPQHEASAEGWLHRRGVYAFHPVLVKFSKCFGRVVQRQERYLPGYVFARFGGEPVQHLVTASPFITGAICRMDGCWGVLEDGQLQDIHRMRAADAETGARRSDDRVRQRQRRRLEPGSGALFRQGVFAGHSCEVVELRASGKTLVRLSIFGREAVLEAENSDLIAKGD